ncbi:Guanine nucleotide-binding protein negative regulator 1 [Lasiodiplodia hormozganensis]|uniref:Guanine nucleotide-binding protein negative regulator 1 n=1 Tax=Lasiodiplodia hormozganensis TaxID=869390 RepID=A0AA40D4D4_9PEZI|nr:Guanine nucleotide-binding protein negative regulator 1 [Lasiodiplodia hormozganensis]
MAEQDTDPVAAHSAVDPVVAMTDAAEDPDAHTYTPTNASELHKKAILQRLRDNDAASNATSRSEESHTLSPSSDHNLSGHVFEGITTIAKEIEAGQMQGAPAPDTSSSSSNSLLEARGAPPVSRHPHLQESCLPYPFRSGSHPKEYHAQSNATWSPDGRQEPIRLFNINSPDSQVQASYPLQSETDDVLHIPVDCIKFLPDNYHFIAAGQNCLATFDATRCNQEPVSQLYTRSKHRKKDRGDPFALSGRISALDYREDGLLAVGTWGNKIGFYESFGVGEVLAVEFMDNMRVFGQGHGIQMLRWSPDGNYLYIGERSTDCITILDVRMSNRKVSYLTGCNNRTRQKHGFDLLVDGNGHRVIAGDSDGVVRVWNNPTTRSEEWDMEPDLEWQAHDDTVAAVAVNPVWPNFFVTTAGSRHFPTEEDYDTSDSSDTDKDQVRHSGKKKPRRGGGVEELDSPVPEGWMKVWRW